MAPNDAERELLRRVRERLEEWTYDARDRVYADLFEGERPALTGEELGLLDRVDSDLVRRGERGLWDADEYGVVPAAVFDGDGPQVVCTYHPEIPYEGYRGERSLDEATRAELNDVLWKYCERVASLVQEDVDEFVRQAGEGV